MSFVHLHTHTEYSMLDGASRVKDLFETAARMGMPALGITDHGVMYGAVDFYKAGQASGVKPILGCELYVATRGRADKNAKERDGNHHMTALATSDEGYRNLVRLVSMAHLEGYYYRPRVDRELLSRYAKGLITTTGCLAGEVGQLLLQGQVEQATKVVGEYQDIFGKENFFVELQDHGIEDQRTTFPHLIEIAKKTGAPLLATNDLHYVRREDAPVHDVLLCIQTGATINEPGRFKFDGEEFYAKSPEEMRALFSDYPEACDNTLLIAERCETRFEFGVNRLPRFETPTEEDTDTYLERLTWEGAERRYGQITEEIRTRVNYELGVIRDSGFMEYFLIVADLIAFARRSGVRVGPGRGSAAGSVVSYCLGIVDVDPLRWGLIFERFLNPGRKEMPDIDMDFDDRRRGDVIRYAVEKYGEDRVAQIVTFGTIKGKQAIRDSARVLGYPYVVGDRLARMYPPSILGKDAPLIACFDPKFEWPEGNNHKNDAYPNATDLRAAYETDADSKKVLDIARGLEGLRRQAGVHAAGVVISDVPLIERLPVWRNEAVGGIVTQFEMKAVADLGLLKMDFLGLKNLTVIEDALTNLRRVGIDLDIDNVPLDDPKTFELLRAGDTVGVFQLAEPGMRELVRRLEPDTFEDVMALVALYRPGPLGAKMHIEYAERKHKRRPVTYPHPDLEPVLRETYGIMLYQEQVIRIATDIAGFSTGEADGFRRAIGKKVHEVMQAQQQMFVDGCLARGYDKKLADELWKLIDHFSGYGFNKSHSCCYGLVAFQTAYLKAHHPHEYMAALLTSFKDKVDRAATYLAECRTMKITVEPPDINISDIDYTPTPEGTIRFGLSAVRNIGENVVTRIIAARTEKGAFTSFIDYCSKVDPICLNRKVIESLAKAGAFDSLKVSRSDLLQLDVEKGVVLADAAARIADAATSRARAEEQGQFSLFGSEPGQAVDLDAELPVGREISQAILLVAEKEMLGVYVSDHPLLAVESQLRAASDTRANSVGDCVDGATVTVGGLVTRLQKRFTRKGEPMATFWLEDLDGAVEVVAFPQSYVKAQALLVPDAIVCVKGKVDLREDQPKIVIYEVFPPAAVVRDDLPVVLQVPAATCTPDLVERLKEVLATHPGPSPVHLKLVRSAGEASKTLRLPHRFAVTRDAGLYAELKALLGPKAL